MKINFTRAFIIVTICALFGNTANAQFKNIIEYPSTTFCIINNNNNPFKYTSNIIPVDLKTTTLLHTNIQKFNVDYDHYKCFFVTNTCDNSGITPTQICNAIEFTLEFISSEEKIDKKLYLFLRDLLLEYINDVLVDNEIKNYCIVLYYHLKKYYHKIINNYDNNNNEICKIFINYCKNNLASNKTKNVNQNKIIKNIESIENLNKPINNLCFENNDYFNDSCEFFNSTITLSNWFEELQDGNGLGLLTTISPNKIEYTTNTFMSIIDYILTVMNYFEKNKNVKYGDLHKKIIISGTAIGTANSLVPLYINKYHWKTVNQYTNLILGLIIDGNPFNYTKKNKNIYFSLLADMTIKLFDVKKIYLNEKYVKIYIVILRTCAEICFENKFNHGIKNYITSYLDDVTEKFIEIDYVKILLQALVTGFLMPKETIDKLIAKLLDNKINDFKFLASYYKMNFIFQDIINSFGSYGKFIKSLEETFGVISDNVCNKIIESINKNLIQDNLTLEDMYVCIK